MKKKTFSKLLFKVLPDLTPVNFDLVTAKSIGFLCYPGWMCGPSLRKVGQGVLDLLIGNEKVLNRQTYAKQYALSSSRGGIKINYKLILTYKCCNKN